MYKRMNTCIHQYYVQIHSVYGHTHIYIYIYIMHTVQKLKECSSRLLSPSADLGSRCRDFLGDVKKQTKALSFNGHNMATYGHPEVDRIWGVYGILRVLSKIIVYPLQDGCIVWFIL